MEPRCRTILLVDSNRTYLMYMGILLRRMGFDVVPATNGTDLLKLAGLLNPGMIIMELDLPDMSCKEIMRHVRADATLRNIPISVISVDSLSETAEYCKQLGCSAYLAKPIVIDDLHSVIQDCLFAPTGIIRKHIRVSINVKVTICHDGNYYDMYAETISEGGMFIRRENPLPVGTLVDIILPVGGDDHVFLTGYVIYTKSMEAGTVNVSPGMAVEFVGVLEQDAYTLREFVNASIAEDITGTQDEPVIVLTPYKSPGDVGSMARECST